ncbi:MAG: hypothetical protein OEY64_04105 [Nitrospinota bacterium]|nr:hypothetical protein [Nitrospinota bacterium]
MKHDTHIYIAAKAIDLTRQSVDNIRTVTGRHLSGTSKSRERRESTKRQRIMRYYESFLREATWAPDDILADNDPNHIFKLFTDKDFPGHNLKEKDKFELDGTLYYRFGGALPYHVDHLARVIAHMGKLRDFNDQFELRQMMYLYMLISHYVTDAHVPMHCDLRDDPPNEGKDQDPSRRKGTAKPKGKYMKSSSHAEVEGIWDDAVKPVAVLEKIIEPADEKHAAEPTELSPDVTFTFKDCKKGKIIVVKDIPKNGLMDFMIDVCIKSKKRGEEIFPVGNPEVMDKAALKRHTREIFADAIGNLMSVWRHIWESHTE